MSMERHKFFIQPNGTWLTSWKSIEAHVAGTRHVTNTLKAWKFKETHVTKSEAHLDLELSEYLTTTKNYATIE